MNIVIIGGGTAGWTTALYANKIFPESKITLIESSEIGILGAGEGTTPHYVALLQYLDLSIFDLINNVGATIKHAIKFDKWSENTFYHSFFDPYKITKENYGNFLNDFNFPTIDYSYTYCLQNKKNVNDYFIFNSICENNKVDVDLGENFYGTWATHFDAKKLANFLKEQAILRGIKLIDSEVVGFNQDVQGNITNILLKDGLSINSDFVFDCSGFYKIIIGKLFNSKWISYNNFLPAKKAIPFSLPINDEIGPYTESTAMNYGWMWKIPVQDRYGCGYVFDSDFISEEHAKKEVEDKMGRKVDVVRSIDFNPGSFEKIWINNCLAVGLSSGFVEPLEATSLWQMVRVLLRFFSNKNNIVEKNENVKNIFNLNYTNDTQEVVDFLHLHYVTKKTNTDFWKNFLTNNEVPEKNKEILERIKYEIPSMLNFSENNMFTYSSYMSIIFGNGLVDKSVVDRYNIDQSKINYLEQRKLQIKNDSSLFSGHRSFLNYIKNNFRE